MLVDLHVHTPASACYKEKKTDARQIIEAARMADLGMIAVTDHHSADWVDTIIKCSVEMNFSVIPGVEVSMKYRDCGSIYFLALFPEKTSSKTINSMLDRLGVPLKSRGFCSYRVKKSPDILIKEVKDLGGILVSDHMDKTEERRSFLPSLVHEYNINLFEWKNENFAETFKEIADNKSFFSLTFSDSHTAESVGRRTSEIPIKEASFAALSQWANNLGI